MYENSVYFSSIDSNRVMVVVIVNQLGYVGKFWMDLKFKSEIWEYGAFSR